MAEASLFEEREDFLVSPTGRNPNFRTAHFLNPTVNSINGPNLKLPSLHLSSESEWPLRVSFFGWRDPPRKWQIWVDRMHSLHQSVWKQAGIYDAIMASTYQTRRNDGVLFGIAERWCCETNTFIFPWGEATISLEDMMILGGFSVLGYPVSTPLQTKELDKLEELLKLAKLKTINAQHSTWLNYFLENQSEFEHEAFLSLWLSRFVFPGNLYHIIGKHVFPIAIHLSKGTRIALAPAVLASIYRDLSLLKETMAASVKLETDDTCEESYLALTLWSPLRFVQIWAWERMTELRPEPNLIGSGCHRLSRWHSLKKLNIENVRFAIDSAGDTFCWRPYVLNVDNWLLPNFYKQKGHWVSVNEALDEETESFVRCLRVSELVGVDCIEPYLPHRVAMQFGVDQDLPKWVPRSTATPEMAWNNYNMPICCNARLYFPHRLFESDVTVRYSEWWRKSVLSPCSSFKGVVRRKRTARRLKRITSLYSIARAKLENDSDFPPGFPPKFGGGGDCINMEEDKTKEQTPVGEDCNGDKCLMKQVEKVIKKQVVGECELAGSSIKNNITDITTTNDDHERSQSSFGFRRSALELEARISKLERLVATLKAAKKQTCI